MQGRLTEFLRSCYKERPSVTGGGVVGVNEVHVLLQFSEVATLLVDANGRTTFEKVRAKVP
jgi:hypothetical protein